MMNPRPRLVNYLNFSFSCFIRLALLLEETETKKGLKFIGPYLSNSLLLVSLWKAVGRAEFL